MPVSCMMQALLCKPFYMLSFISGTQHLKFSAILIPVENSVIVG